MIEKLEQYHKDGLLQKQIHPTLDLTIWNYSNIFFKIVHIFISKNNI
jgi:hypothetical protein